MYSCLEHIEELMDHFLDENGKLPILVEVEIEHRCHHCENADVYKIIEGMTIDEDDSF